MSRSSSPTVLQVWFVTTGLGAGGAERSLATLLPRLSGRGVSPRVFSLRGEGRFGPELRSKGVEVVDLRIAGPATAARGCFRLAGAARRAVPALLQGWMYHGNLLATAASALAGVPSSWAVRQSLADFAQSPPSLRAVIRIGAILSRRTRAVLYNARVALEQHRELGYDPPLDAVVPNGFDLDRFRPDAGARVRLRARLGVAAATPLVGCIARLHPVKGIDVLLDAFERLAPRRDAPRLVLAGRDLGPDGAALGRALEARRCRASIHALGEVDDVADLVAGFDVAVQASRGEGFPNAVGEAMACGVPVVATRVGDTGTLVGEAGTLVPPSDPDALAEAVAALLDLPALERARRGEGGRDRIVGHFSADRAAEKLAAFLRLAAGNPA